MQGIELALNKIGARGDIVLIKIKGYIDTSTSSEVSTKLNKIINEGMCQLIIDMGGVNYVSSAGWGVFVGEIRTIRENSGDLKIVQMTPDVCEVFEMLEFNRILESVPQSAGTPEPFTIPPVSIIHGLYASSVHNRYRF